MSTSEMEKIRSNDKYLRMASDDLKKLFDAAAVWDKLESYQRFSILESCGMLRMEIPTLRNARKRGELTQRQLKLLAVLERQFDDALGTLKILKQRDEELYAREKKERENE